MTWARPHGAPRLLVVLASLAAGAFALLPREGARAEPPAPGVRDAGGERQQGPKGPLATAALAPHRTAEPAFAWRADGCARGGCHAGIEPIREPSTGMMRAIFDKGRAAGDGDGCVVCHGGTPEASTAALAHAGAPAAATSAGGPDTFFPDPASPWVNERSCGQCHMELVTAERRSLMMTEAGKIQGTTWSFGALEGYEHRWGNYDVENPKDRAARLGTPAYRAYMEEKTRAHPNVFVDRHEAMPAAPTFADLGTLAARPETAVYTYIRNQCDRCHLGVKGRQTRGDFRGMGCGACHVPYGNEGLYEGADRSIASGPGHMLVHRLQATREAKVAHNGLEYSGIPAETCTTCHNRGKRIGVSFQGLMESAFDSPYTEGGGGQLPLHTKHYIAMAKDVHYERGMLCQDCHTSGDVHGDNYLAAANLGAVEIECSDCHGTPKAYPWELPLGWGDENGKGAAKGAARGVAQELPAHLAKGTPAPRRDGYLLTARGNPMPEIVRDGQQVIVHSVGGKDFRIDPLKRKVEAGSLSVEAKVAMLNVDKHIDTMECYSCHSSWAPQCYGCHVKVDFSAGKRSFDWVAAGHAHQSPEHRTDRSEEGYATFIPGTVTEVRSYMRWEDPPLGVNGEGRVTPLIPGCQVSATIIGGDGRTIAQNKIFRTLPHSEGAGPEGQLGLDMSPVAPHTVGKSRSCESCHASAKALGYGIGGGMLNQPWNEKTVVDLQTAGGKTIPRSAKTQIEPVEGLEHDWSQVVTPDGKQLQTVGHHFAGSGPLSNEQRANMDRRNVCVGCHEEIPDKSLAVGMLHHIAEYTGKLPKDRGSHDALLRKIVLTSAWSQTAGVALGSGGVGVAIGLVWRRRRRRKREAREADARDAEATAEATGADREASDADEGEGSA